MVDLGLVRPALVLLLLGPLLAVAVRRRWALAAARREEVRRRALLAAEEAERAEFEAALTYAAELSPAVAAANFAAPVAAAASFVALVSAPRAVCAVCFNPTTTRCSRCKAVRYCSGKCQIIHWRQGHKNECHPPSGNDKGDSTQLNFHHSGEVAKSASFDNAVIFEEVLPGKAVDTYSNTCQLSQFNYKNISNKDNELEGFGNVESFDDISGHEAPNITSADGSGNLNLIECLPSEVTDVSSPGHNLSYLKGSKARVATSKDEAVEFNHSSYFSLVGTHYVDCISPEFPQRINKDNKAAFAESARTIRSDKHPSTYISQKAEHAEKILKSSSKLSNKLISGDNSVCEGYRTASSCAGSCDGTDEFMVKEQHALGIKKSEMRSKASGCVSRLSSSVGHSVSNEASEKAENAPKVLRSAENQVVISNGLETYVKDEKHYRSAKAIGQYSSELVLFPYDLFVKLYNCEKVELRPCGLTNCGNSCYANVVLQCLTFTRPITAYLLEGIHFKTCQKKEWCFTCEFGTLIMRGKQTKSALSPMGILSHLHKIGSNFRPGREEDAHEFLRCTIDAMQSACLKEAGTNFMGRLAEQTTLVQQAFGGYLQSKIMCMKCQGKSEQCERIMDLTVEIPGDIGTLEEALVRFTSTEVLDGENKYFCNRCRSYEQAKKKLTIMEAPNILTIAFKRFESGKFGKLNKSVWFPEYLNLARYMSRTDDDSPVYRLYAVVVHIDKMNAAFSGHYVCYVKDAQGKWYKIDDSKVKPVELETVLSNGAYMLLYARCSPRPPGVVSKAVSQQKSHLFPQCMADKERTQSQADSSSDCSSLFSCSDEGSCVTNSTGVSTGTDEDSEHLSGELDPTVWNSCFEFSEIDNGFRCSTGSWPDSPRSLNSP